MCGLAGGITLNTECRPDEDAIRRMSSSVAHRGPDDDGWWISPSGLACYAHRRLSIIDLEAGQQPFIGSDGHRGLVFNGAIYNYVELREELKRLGVAFSTESDTEVLFQALIQWGEQALERLIGMFAFAFWDDRSRRLLLARDRVGKKPLYYTRRDGCLYFCSTLAGLEHAFRTDSIEPTAVENFLNLGYVPAPSTIFQNIWKLPAASVLSVTPGRAVAESRRFWEPTSSTGAPIEEPEETLHSLIEDAVRLRLRSDVPLGVFLSGGIDSSLVTAMASNVSEDPIATFTVGFGSAEFDERERARRIARHLGTDHREYVVEPDVVRLLPELVRHFGEPFADAAALPLWVLTERARPEITVALLGDGGDEGFAGYDWYRTASRYEAAGAVLKNPAVAPLVGALAKRLGRQAERLALLLTSDAAERFADLRCLFGPKTTAPIFTSRFLESLDPARRARALLKGLYRADLRRILAMQYVDLRTYLADDLLPKVDICTMAHGLEARAPLLDHRILEFAYRLPASVHDADKPKLLLRRILQRYVPVELTEGPKRGFTVPLKDWFRTDLRDMIERIPDGPLMDTGWFERDGIRSIMTDHLAGRRDNSNRLFHLLMLQIWMER